MEENAGDGRIILDVDTKVITSGQVAVRCKGQGAERVDVTRDTILIIDSRTHRPVAMIRPLAAALTSASTTSEAPATTTAADLLRDRARALVERKAAEPRLPQATMPAPAPAPASAPAPKGATAKPQLLGRLTDAEREKIARLWTEHPTWEAEQVAAAFEKAAGRTITLLTAEKYRIRPPKRPGLDEVKRRVEAAKDE